MAGASPRAAPGRFGFVIEPATWDAIRESAPHLGRLSAERVKQELEKVMEQIDAPSETLERYREAGVFGTLIPALADAPRPEADIRRGAAQLGRRAAAIVDDAFTNGWWTQRP